MEIKKKSYQIFSFNNKNYIVNVGNTVTCWNVSSLKMKPKMLWEFSKLKYPSYVAISPDESLVAYQNTSGHFAVHNLKTGELLLKHPGLQIEGYEIYFINENKKILSCTQNGKFYTLDLESKRTEIVFDLKETMKISITGLYQIPGTSQFIVIPSTVGKSYLCMFDCVSCQFIIICEFTGKESFLEKASFSKSKFYFTLREYLEDQVKMFSYDLQTGSVQLAAVFPKSIFYNYTTSLCVSSEDRNCFICTANNVMWYDLKSRKNILTIPGNYISSVNIIDNDTKIAIGTWNHIMIYSRDELNRDISL